MSLQPRNSEILRLSPSRYNPRLQIGPLIASAIIIAENYPEEIDAIEMNHKLWH